MPRDRGPQCRPSRTADACSEDTAAFLGYLGAGLEEADLATDDAIDGQDVLDFGTLINP